LCSASSGTRFRPNTRHSLSACANRCFPRISKNALSFCATKCVRLVLALSHQIAAADHPLPYPALPLCCGAGVYRVSSHHQTEQHTGVHRNSGRTRFHDHLPTVISRRLQLVRVPSPSVPHHLMSALSPAFFCSALAIGSGFNCAESVNFATEHWIPVLVILRSLTASLFAPCSDLDLHV
jgi:hypothetical protein